MRKLAKIVQSGRINPTFYISKDIHASVMEAIDGWEDSPMGSIGHAPEVEAYEVWMVRVDDSEWSECETLPVGEYHTPTMAHREMMEDIEYVYQPLLVGKRIQLHKNNSVVSAFDHKGRPISGCISIGEEDTSISPALLSLLGLEVPSVAIFDAVVEAETGVVVVTDILVYEDIAADRMAGGDRMALLDSIEFDGEHIKAVEWGVEPIENSIARPMNEEYYSKWIVVPGATDDVDEEESDEL